MCDGFSVYRRLSYECGCCKIVKFVVCSSSHNFYVLGVLRPSDQPSKCLMAMAKVYVVRG